MDQAIQDFIQCKRIAIVGVSRSGRKFGNAAMRELKRRGFEVIPIHPEAARIDGEPCAPNLTAVRGRAQAVLVCVPPANVLPILREAAAVGLRCVWLQQGAESPEALAVGRELGLELIAGKCVLMYAPPVSSYHGWHRAFVRMIGRL
jgi:hypothetical protein